MWFSNVPHPRLVEDKGGQNWIAIKGDKIVFPGGGTQFIHGADQYLDQICIIFWIKFVSMGLTIKIYAYFFVYLGRVLYVVL